MTSTAPQRPGLSLLTSLLFWASLSLAALLWAGVLLSPRYVEGEQLRERYRLNQSQLTALEHELQHSRRLSESLEHSPGFAARLAEIEFGTTLGAANRTAAAPGDIYDPRMLPPLPQPAHVAPRPWLLSPLELLAGSVKLRERCAWSAAILLLFAFGCCHEAFLAGGAQKFFRRASRSLQSRYTPPPSQQ